MNPLNHMQWIGDAATGYLRLLDQTVLPGTETYIDCKDVQTVWDAIKRLSVRGAPAIGITAAFGMVIAAQKNTMGRAVILMWLSLNFRIRFERKL